jgi:hypothetical protein
VPGFGGQNSDGNVSAKLNKPITNIAANAATIVMRAYYFAGVDSPMTQACHARRSWPGVQ